MPVSDPEATQDETPASRRVPSFDSLRNPRRRSAIDLLVPIPESTPATPEPAAEPVGAPAPRPPDYADLVRLGLHLIRFSVVAPLRLARWSAGLPGRGLRRLTSR